MRNFKDKNGRVWEVDVTTKTLLAIKDKLGFDLLDDPEALPTSFSSLVDILWVVCFEQCNACGMDEEAFAGCLDGDSLANAIDCFMEELGSFFTLLQGGRGKAHTALWRASKKVDDLESKVVETVLGLLSSGSQDAAESTPCP